MTSFIVLLQKTNIDEKIKNAPDEGYQIGVLIGSYLPFIILVLLAYWTYNRAKNRKE
ncbi:hypothetical protein [Flavobacterium gilvum]|uniref:hypothetical protein n=1 Tax=Flavobacterium gilvum TaxID=1492737 RepID=UPI0004E38F0F|nr:hypothetical protein [Flavobacterium gilvum]KFC58513.1 hypothetical protein FEM08_27260 [Flavobacterium gilvum]